MEFNLKEIIEKAREINKEIMKRNNSNDVLLSISIYNEGKRDWEHFNPFTFDLRKINQEAFSKNIYLKKSEEIDLVERNKNQENKIIELQEELRTIKGSQ